MSGGPTAARAVFTPREVGLEAYFVLMVPLAVAVMGQHGVGMMIFTLANLAARFAANHRKGDAIFFLLGVAAGGGNDLVSMIRGVYAYTPPHWLPWPIPMWMFLFWGQVFLLFRRVFALPAFDEKADDGGGSGLRSSFRPDRRLLVDLAILVLFKASVYRWAAHPVWPSLVGAVLLGARLAVLRPTRGERNLLLLTLAAGPAYEILLVRLGLYNYSHGYFFGLPIWLLVFWALAVLVSRNVYARMERWPILR